MPLSILIVFVIGGWLLTQVLFWPPLGWLLSLGLIKWLIFSVILLVFFWCLGD